MTQPRLLIYTEEFLSPSMTFIARQITSLQNLFEVSVLSRAQRNADLFPFEGLKVVPLTMFERLRSKLFQAVGSPDWSLTGHAKARLGHTIDLISPDIIHAHFGPSGLAILPLARARGIPLVVTFHGFDASSLLKRRGYLKKLTELFEYASIVTVSNEMRQRLIDYGADPARTFCHYIGVPVANYKGPSREAITVRNARYDNIRFLQVSNFVEKKGHEITLQAFRMLKDRSKNCELVLAGAGPLLQPMQKLADELKLGESVRFLGHQDSQSVSELMQDADCFVHHSVTGINGDMEGIPTVLMEAMASGLPVITTRHAGIPELVTDRVNGLLVGERDTAAYGEALYSVLGDDGHMGRRAKTTIERAFDIDACSQCLAHLLITLSAPNNLPQRGAA